MPLKPPTESELSPFHYKLILYISPFMAHPHLYEVISIRCFAPLKYMRHVPVYFSSAARSVGYLCKKAKAATYTKVSREASHITREWSTVTATLAASSIFFGMPREFAKSLVLPAGMYPIGTIYLALLHAGHYLVERTSPPLHTYKVILLSIFPAFLWHLP